MSSAIRNIISRQTGTIDKIKEKVKDEGKKGVGKLKSKLPTKETLEDRFTKNICSKSTIDKCVKNYEKYSGKIKNIQKIVEASKKALESLQSKCAKVLEILGKVTIILATFDVIISILNKVISVTKALLNGVGMIPGQFSFPAGPLIKADKAADVAKGKIMQYKNAVTVYSKSINRPMDAVRKVIEILVKAIAAITAFSMLINFLIQFLETLFLMLLQKCSVSNPGGDDADSSTGNNQTENVIPSGGEGPGVTPEQYLASIGYPGYTMDEYASETIDPTNYDASLDWLHEQILRNLKLQGQEEIIEKIHDAKFQQIGYRRYKTINLTLPVLGEDDLNAEQMNYKEYSVDEAMDIDASPEDEDFSNQAYQ